MSHYANLQRRGRYNNQLARSDNSDETDYTSRYSQGSNYYGDDQYYYESGNQSYQSRSNRDSFNSGVVSAQQDLGSFHSGHSDVQSVQSYGASSYHSRQGNQRSLNDNASVCGSTSATTVAGGGRGRCPYQIGFNVQNAGKQISTSKRIIHFRFGFANPQALASGLAGVDCRGQEHDLSITWSITGGKRMISIDGREIQYSVGKRSNTARRADIVEAAWRMADHVIELKCYAYKPKAGSPEKRNPKWKQYNLTIDGRSFFELPEIFDLGLRGLGTGRLPVTISSGCDWDQTTDTSSKKTSSSAASTQYTDQSSVKSSVQSRIEEQRRLLNRKKPGATNVKKSQPQNSNTSMTSNAASDLSSSDMMSFRSLSVTDDQEDYGVFSSGVYSAEPSELREVRNRQNSAGEQTNGARVTNKRTEHRQQSASTSEQVQTQKRHQPQTLPAMSEPSPTVENNRRVENQYSPKRDIPVKDMATHITLAPQQPPTYEEITQALVPSPFVPSQHYQHQSSSMRHQLQALPPSSSQLQILPEHQPARNSSHYQPHLPNSDQRNAQTAGTYSHHEPQPTYNNQRSPQPAGSSSYYQAQPTNNAKPADSSSHYQSQPLDSNQRSAELAGTSSHYPPQPTNSAQQPHAGSSSCYQPKPASSNQRSAEPRAINSQPTHNNQRNGREQPINKHHEALPQQPIPGNLPKGTNKFAFF